MAVLTAEDRRKMPQGSYALPGKRYPIPDEGHAKAALARVSEFGTHEEKEKVRSAVRRKFKDMTVKRKAVK